MIVLRKKTYYIVSSNPDLEKHILHPAVPNNFLVRGGYIDSKLPRISVFQSITDALSATFLGQKLRPGSRMYVYEIRDLNPESLIGPLDITQVPYYREIKEWWYLKSCSIKFVAEIEIGKLKEEGSYMYGPRQTKAPVYKYRWTEIQKPWEKKFGPKLKKFSDPLYNLSDKQLEVLSDRVTTYRKKKRQEKKKLQAATNNTLSTTSKYHQNLAPTTQDEATKRASNILKYKKAIGSEQNMLKREFINTIRNDNT